MFGPRTAHLRKDVGGTRRAAIVIIIKGAGYNSIIGERYTKSEIVACCRVAGREFCLLTPSDTSSLIDVNRSTAVVSICSNRNGVTVEGNRIAEQIVGRTIDSSQLGLLCPSRSVTFEYIGCTRSTRVSRGSCHNRISVYGKANTEEIADCPVAGNEFRLLGPGGAGSLKYIGSPRQRAIMLIAGGRHNNGVAVNCHGVAKAITVIAVGGCQLRLFSPSIPDPLEDIRGSRTGSEIVVILRAHDDSITVNRNCLAETIDRREIAGDEFRLFDPSCSNTLVDIGCARVASNSGGILKNASHHKCVAADRYRSSHDI